MNFLFLYLISLPILIAGDLSWLGFIAHDFYFSALGDLVRTNPNWYAAGAFYVLYPLGLTYFATYPAYREKSFRKAVLLGAFFGFITYATYDLTNLAILNGWPMLLSFVDMLWGAVLGGSVSGCAYALVGRFRKFGIQ